MEDADAHQHTADEQMQAVQEERRRHDDRVRELLDVATKLINQTARSRHRRCPERNPIELNRLPLIPAHAGILEESTDSRIC